MLPQFSTLASFSFPQDEFESNKILEQFEKDQVNSQRSLGFTQRYKQIVNSEQNLIIEQLNNNKIISKLNLDSRSKLNSSSIENIELFSNPNFQEIDLQKIECNKKDSIQKFGSQILSSQRLLDNQISIYSPIFRPTDSVTPHSPKKNPYLLTLNVIHELDQSQAENGNNNNVYQITNGLSKKDESFQSDQEDSYNQIEEKNQQQKNESIKILNNPNFDNLQNNIKQHAKKMEFKQEQLHQIQNLRRFSTNEIQSINDEAIINENFIFYFNPNTDLQLSIESTTLDVLSQIENSIKNLMIIAILLTFVIISAILPVYFNIQNTNQEILKLFSTFEPRILTQMVFNLEKSIQSTFQMQKQMKNSDKIDMQKLQKQQKTQIILDQLMIKMQTNPKNKVISSMNNIKKISPWLLFTCVFVYISLIIQPIVNNFIISSLIEQQVFNLKVMKTIYDLKAHFGSNLYLNMGNILERMCQNCAFFERDYFKVRVPVFFDLNQQKLQGLYEVVTNQSGYKKYNSDLYDQFLFKIMKGNLCEALRDYPQYLDMNFTFDFNQCNQLQQDILTKGFMISSKYLLEIFPPLFQLTQNNDLHLVQQEIKQWVQQVDLIQFDEFITYMINTVTALTNFMIDMTSEKFSNSNKACIESD
ncbi:transmembrane protein, putative (macronuclear) [Tetrahymena thermophila SB210]|uniref:Transmembrane protein, putative n=1 Tax=Tetrahymena thermophila (strain SB210) TaxID=312017 RepID=Q22P40_TETTS|nr:transmembrane protein, putative [Tetrahymena thermophila SB210]EAR86971.2 transmembrane protein, putative [Tetrahymena thermophila SB210]|eukprot:XP_001007216.2 transmembrane protein, putative [Tetrahymena thermophila SB210]